MISDTRQRYMFWFLYMNIHNHGEKLFVGDFNPSIHVGVVLTKGTSQGLQLDAKLNEIIKGNMTWKGTRKKLQLEILINCTKKNVVSKAKQERITKTPKSYSRKNTKTFYSWTKNIGFKKDRQWEPNNRDQNFKTILKLTTKRKNSHSKQNKKHLKEWQSKITCWERVAQLESMQKQNINSRELQNEISIHQTE